MDLFEVTIDEERNVLRSCFRGIIAGPELALPVTQAERLIAAMRPGFIVVTDLVDLERMELECVPHVTRLMDLFVASGVGKVVRVIPDPNNDIGFNLLSLTHYRGRVPIVTCGTREEAERELTPS